MSRSLSVANVYNVPPFAVSFRTQHLVEEVTNAAGGDSWDYKNHGGKLLLSQTVGLDSSLSHPIREITTGFLTEKLEDKILDLMDLQGQATTDPNSPQWYSMYRRMLSLDLTVSLYLLRVSNDEAGGQPSRRLSSHATLEAHMICSIAFEKPSDNVAKPSNEEVRSLFGTWLEEIFEEHRDDYLTELIQSEQEMLQQIVDLDVQTNTDQLQDNSGGKSKYAEGWSERTERALLTILILLSVVGMVWALLSLRRRRRKLHGWGNYEHTNPHEIHQEAPDALELDKPAPVTRSDRANSMDAARHGMDAYNRRSHTGALSVLESTDRYLSKHRPDLYQDDPQQQANSVNVFGRSYSIPSNPFEYFYSSFYEPGPDPASGSNFVTSPQGAFTPRGGATAPPSSFGGRRSSVLEAQQENIAAQPFDEVDEEDNDIREDERRVMGETTESVGHWAGGGGYRPISSIWRNITNIWDYDSAFSNVQRPQSIDDGLVVQTPPCQEPVSDGVGLEMQTIPLDDAMEYDFVFQDFPRHDGTPCLLFDEEAFKEKERREIFEIDSPNNGEDGGALADATTPVSDEEFQRMLGLPASGSMEDSIFSDEQQGTATTFAEAKSPEFVEALGRLMQQKHRQYEKRAIVEKHQEKRAAERKQTREQERRHRHKVMEREIEDIEAAFSSPLERTRVMQLSPNPYYKSSAGSLSPVPPRESQPHQHQSPSPRTMTSRPTSSPFRHPAGRTPSSPFRAAMAQSPGHQDVVRSSSYQEGIPSGGSGGTRISSQSPTRQVHTDEASALFRPKAIHSALSDATGQSPGSRPSRTSDYSMNQRTIAPSPSAMSRQSGPMFIDTALGASPVVSDLHFRGDRDSHEYVLDTSALDKLTMPTMTIDGKVGFGPKYPSPHSVVDELIGSHSQATSHKNAMAQNSPTTSLRHRRVNSFDHKLPSTGIDSRRVPPQRRRTPTKNGRRERSLTPTNRRAGHDSRSQQQHRYTNSQPRLQPQHGRSNSHSNDDVFTHGIFAQTRFV